MLNELLHKYLYKQPSKDDARSIKRWIDTCLLYTSDAADE